MKNLVFIVITVFTFLIPCSDEESEKYLGEVLEQLEKINSASYLLHSETWNPGDTAYAFAFTRYVESYRNPADTTIGSSWATFDTRDKVKLNFAYDGKMRTLIYDDVKGMVIDSFKVRKLPFRPVSAPFYNYTENIIRYILENEDSTILEQKDLGNEVYFKLTIHEDRQVEFFGKAHYMPKNPYTYDPTSIYELWIDKNTNLPYKYRREMSHNITVASVSNAEFNKLKIENFVAANYFPKGYEIRRYGQKSKRLAPNELIEKRAPDWLLTSSNGEIIELKDLKSKVVMLQFTGIYCGPCRVSIPFLKDLATEYPKSDFDFAAIENSAKSIEALKHYQNRNDFDYPFLMATKAVTNDYQIRAVPVFYLLDENRIVRKVIIGYAKERTDQEIRTAIDGLL